MAKRDYVSRIIEVLSKEGKSIVDKQMTSIGYKHRTNNLHDSYGWGVYHNGELKNYGTNAAKASEGREVKGKVIKGHDAILQYLQSVHKPQKGGIELVVVAAMPYAAEVELKYRYEVIATARSMMKSLCGKFKGALFGTI